MNQEDEKKIEHIVEDSLSSVKSDYSLIHKSHIRAWKAWLAIGLVVGIATGVILVANRSGEVEKGKAANEEVYSEEYIPQPLNIQTKETDTTQKARDLSLAVLRLANKIKQESGAVRLLDMGILSKKLTERKGLIATVLKEDPFTAFTLLFPASVIAGLPSEARSIVEEPLTAEGKIEIMHFDDFKDNTKSFFQYFLRAKDGKRRRFYPVGGEPSLMSGSTIRIKGHKIGEDLIAPMGKDSFEVLAPETPDSIGDQKTLVVLMTFLDSPPPPFSAEQAKKLVFEDQMQAFYKEASYGKISWSGDVVGWFTAQRNGIVDGVCQWPQFPGQASFDEIYKFIQGSADLHNYRRLVIMANHPCMGGGYGTVGKYDLILDSASYRVSIAWIGDLDSFSYPTPIGYHPFKWYRLDSTLSHELGHNLGAWHANNWDCGVGKVLYGICAHQEYGNFFDVMGIGQDALHFNAFYKEMFGWLSDSLLTITKTGTYTLTPLESSSGVRIAKIKPPFLTSAPYYLEYRRALGFDAALQDQYIESNQHGIFVNWIPRFSQGFGFSRLLDLSPSLPIGSDGWTDWDNASLLLRGYSQDPNVKTGFYDKGRGVIIGPVLKVDDTGSMFTVGIIPPRCVKNVPQVTLFDFGFPPYTVSTTAGDSRVFPFNFQNLDSPTCTPSRFQVSAIVSSGLEYKIPNPNPILLSPQDLPGYGWIEVNVPPTTSPGQYTVTLRVTNLDTQKVTDNVITYTITP